MLMSLSYLPYEFSLLSFCLLTDINQSFSFNSNKKSQNISEFLSFLDKKKIHMYNYIYLVTT